MIPEILIVDDNADIRNIINELISDAGYKTRTAANYNQALTEIDKKMPDVAILDVKIDKGDNDGIQLLTHIKSKNNDVPVIMISGHGDLKTAVKAMRVGAFDYIEKPPDLNNLLNSVRGALKFNKTTNTSKVSKTIKKGKYEIVGSSNKISNLKNLILKIAPTNAKVLILGPNGAGKELVARQIHINSLRNEGPFIEVNCAATVSYTHLTLPTKA